jgi:hypothetical protein
VWCRSLRRFSAPVGMNAVLAKTAIMTISPVAFTP